MWEEALGERAPADGVALAPETEPIASQQQPSQPVVEHHGTRQVWVAPEAWAAVEAALAAHRMMLTQVPSVDGQPPTYTIGPAFGG